MEGIIYISQFYLNDWPTLIQGQHGNLKIDTGEVRVWVSRMTEADGESEPIQIEKLFNGRWIPFRGDVHLRRGNVLYGVRYLNRGTYTRQYDDKIYSWED